MTVVTQIDTPVLSATRSNFTFPSQTGVLYVTEYKTNITSTNWTGISTSSGTGGTMSIPDSITNAAARFYRVRVQ